MAPSSISLAVHLSPDIQMYLDPSDLISRVLLETGEWEPDTWAAIEHHLGSESVFVDVGAHIGYFALKAASRVGPRGRVVAIEANPKTIRALRINVEANGSNILIAPVACSESTAELELFAADGSNTGSSSLVWANASAWGSVRTVHRVMARPLDEILEELRVTRVDVLKIDVEGAELRVIRGAVRALSQYKPIVVIELDDKLLAAAGSDTSQVTQCLGSYGYICSGHFDQDNYLFVPAGR